MWNNSRFSPEDWDTDGNCPGVGELDGTASTALPVLFRGVMVGDTITRDIGTSCLQ